MLCELVSSPAHSGQSAVVFPSSHAASNVSVAELPLVVTRPLEGSPRVGRRQRTTYSYSFGNCFFALLCFFASSFLHNHFPSLRARTRSTRFNIRGERRRQEGLLSHKLESFHSSAADRSLSKKTRASPGSNSSSDRVQRIFNQPTFQQQQHHDKTPRHDTHTHDTNTITSHLRVRTRVSANTHGCDSLIRAQYRTAWRTMEGGVPMSPSTSPT